MPDLLDKYVGFYTMQPFWAGEALHTQEFVDRQGQGFTEAMENIVISRHSTGRFSLHVCKDGMFLFRIMDVEAQLRSLNPSYRLDDPHQDIVYWSLYLNYINCYLLLFNSIFLAETNFAYFDYHELNKNEILVVQFADGKLTGISSTELTLGTLYQLGRYWSSYSTQQPLRLDFRLRQRPSVGQNVIEKSINLFDSIFDQPDCVYLLARFAKSMNEYAIGNYDTALVLMWFVVEYFLQREWEEWLDDANQATVGGEQRINNKRRRLLLGRDYSASVISEILELNTRITYQTYKKITQLRKIRNDIVHTANKMSGATYADCIIAIDVINEFFAEKIGFALTVSSGYGHHSILDSRDSKR